MQNLKFSFEKLQKKPAHAYFGRPYFSKFFGGKIENFQTDVNDMEKLKEKTEHTYCKRPYFF